MIATRENDHTHTCPSRAHHSAYMLVLHAICTPYLAVSTVKLHVSFQLKDQVKDVVVAYKPSLSSTKFKGLITCLNEGELAFNLHVRHRASYKTHT